MNNVSDLFQHPSVADSPTEELTEQILRSRLRQQLTLNWVLGGIGVATFLIVLGIAIAVWRFALTF